MDCFSLSTEIRQSVTFWDSQLPTIICRIFCLAALVSSVAHCPETGAEHTDIQDVEG